jgi:hypothetical protein
MSKSVHTPQSSFGYNYFLIFRANNAILKQSVFWYKNKSKMKVLDYYCIFSIILLASSYVKAFKVTVRELP